MNKVLIILLFLAMALSSCASEASPQKAADDEPFFDPPATVEAQKREAVFVYKDKSPNTAKKLTLKLNGEPVLLASVYVRLAGVVSGPARHAEHGDAGGGRPARRSLDGGGPIALVEAGGRALALRNGDTVSGYRVLGILLDKVSLVRKEEKECGK